MKIPIDSLSFQLDEINQLYHRYDKLEIIAVSQSQKHRIRYSTEEGESGFLTDYITPAEIVGYLMNFKKEFCEESCCLFVAFLLISI